MFIQIMYTVDKLLDDKKFIVDYLTTIINKVNIINNIILLYFYSIFDRFPT